MYTVQLLNTNRQKVDSKILDVETSLEFSLLTFDNLKYYRIKYNVSVSSRENCSSLGLNCQHFDYFKYHICSNDLKITKFKHLHINPVLF